MEYTENVRQWAKVIHENAVVHGWWEEERPDYEVLALVHSEFSEALEEYRADRGWVWYGADGKPEGIGTEIADGVIRLLDWLEHKGLAGFLGGTFTEIRNIYLSTLEKLDRIDIGCEPMVIHALHRYTSFIPTAEDFDCDYEADADGRALFRDNVVNNAALVIALAAEACERAGCDFAGLIRDKHMYNVHRPYRHGGKVC